MKRYIALVALAALVLPLPMNLAAVDQKIIHGFNFGAPDQSYYNRRLDSFVQENKAIQNNQLVIGHSMGGLITMGVLNAVEGDTNQPSGIITVDSPVTGFAGLDHGFDRMKANVLDTAAVHTRGISAAVALCPLSVFGQALTIILPEPVAFTGVAVTGALLDVFDETALVASIMSSSSTSNKASLIKDMAKASDYVKNNVQETKIWYEREIVGYKTELAIEWRSKKVLFVTVSYPVIVTKTVPQYGNVQKSRVEVKHRTDVPIGHVVGTDNDPLRMAGSDEGTYRTGITCLGVGYGVVAAANTAMAVATFPIGTAYYAYHAVNATGATVWCADYKNKWGDIIGSRQSDAFIATSTQRTYYNTNVDPKGSFYFATMKIDHARSTPDSSSTDPLNYQMWGPDGLVHQVSKNMKANYNPVRK